MTPVKLRDATRKMCEQTSDSCITKCSLVIFRTGHRWYSRDGFFAVITIGTVQLLFEYAAPSIC